MRYNDAHVHIYHIPPCFLLTKIGCSQFICTMPSDIYSTKHEEVEPY